MLECIVIIMVLITIDKLLGIHKDSVIDEETLDELKIIK
jgi:hypothetical protein